MMERLKSEKVLIALREIFTYWIGESHTKPTTVRMNNL